MIGKLISLISLGGTVASVAMLKRFLAGLTVVIALTIVSALMVAVLISGCFVALYIGLTRFGIDSDMALTIVGLLILSITVISGWLAVIKMRELRELPFHPSDHSEIPSLSKLGGIAAAFAEGLLTTRYSNKVSPIRYKNRPY